MEILTARYLLPITSSPLFQGALVIDKDKIVDIGPEDEIVKAYKGVPVRSFERHALLPGLINAHACLTMGLVEPEKIPSRYIESQVASLEIRRSQSLIQRRQSIINGLKRAIRSGTTMVSDVGHYGGVLKEVQGIGPNLRISTEIIGTTQADQQFLFEEAFTLADQVEHLGSDQISAGIAPHSPYSLSRNFLKILSQHAAGRKLPMTIQAAASFCEMEFFFESKGEIADFFFPKVGWGENLPPPHRKTPIAYLDSIGFLNKQTTLVGCTHLSDLDMEIIAGAGSSVVTCPISATYFGLGSTPVKKLREKKIPVGLGTGTWGVVNQLCLWDVMQKSFKTEQTPPIDLLDMATNGGARVMGLESEIGSLEKGKKADFILVETGDHLPIEQIPVLLVSETNASQLSNVFVRGSEVV